MSRCLLAAAFVALAMTDPALAADPRPMTVDDLFAFKRVGDPQVSPDGKSVVYQVTEITDPANNKKHTHLWLAATDGKSSPRPITSSGKSDSHPRWSPDGSKILFESNRGGTPQLYVLDLVAGGEAKKITSIATGAGTGIWSPDGKSVAFVSAVDPAFSTLPFAESDKKNGEKDDAAEKSPVKVRTSDKLFFRHWDSYVEGKRQHLFVTDVAGKTCRDVTPGDRDAYPTSTTFSVGDDFTFSPDSSHLIFTAVPAKGEAWSTNHDLCRVSVDNKSTDWETLTANNPAADGSPQFSPDGKRLAWRAQKRAGYEADKWDLMVAEVNPDGRFAGEPKNVTAVKDISANEFVWVVEREDGANYLLFTADENGRSNLFSAIVSAPYTSKPVSPDVEPIISTKPFPGSVVGLSSTARLGSPKPWNEQEATVFLVAGMDGPPEVFLKRKVISGRASNSDPDPISQANKILLAELDLPKPESVTVDVEGGKMQMWILKPPGFDAKKKYPVVYIVHGGPQVPFNDSWSFRWNAQVWAARGYVVAMPNARGSPGWGQKYVDEIAGDWGGKCYRDLYAGVNYLKALPYVDSTRLSAAGGSFGGYMMNWFAVSEIAKEFKCLITHCSVYNFESMWGTTDELWFDEWEHQGLPWEKPGSYSEFSPHKKAGNFGKNKVPMLVIHNDLDFRCPIGQGLELFSALQRQGVPSRLVNFPDEGHWVLKPANSKKWHEEVFGWLEKYCPPGGK